MPFSHNFLRFSLRTAALALGVFLAAGPACAAPDSVLWKREPTDDWNRSSVQPLESLPDWEAPADPDERSYLGGWAEQRVDEGTGYFRVEQIHGRWWMVDPQGYLFYNVGLTSVRPPSRSPAKEAYAARWDSEEAWAADTVALLREHGFNAIGRWSALDALQETPRPLPYTTSFNFMGSFGKELGLTRHGYGHARYRHNAIPVFHPDFAAHCDALAAEEIAPLALDSHVIGHFTDNELPMHGDALAATLAIDPEEAPALRHNLEFAREWLRERHGPDATADDVTREDNRAYLGAVMDRYYAITTSAIKKHAPHHLNLGSRLHGGGIYREPVIEAANRHLDVISINYYNIWRPADHHLERWRKHAPDTPFLITEFYVKGEDSGMDNSPGAGWIVPTQRDRGLWYQNFTLSLLAAPHCVGWHYFNYQDTPGDSNKGILNQQGKPHGDFIDLMTPVHRHVHSLRDHIGWIQRDSSTHNSIYDACLLGPFRRLAWRPIHSGARFPGQASRNRDSIASQPRHGRR